jgi:pimeloyl-ACP methyl ester carboxylesterase
MSHPVDRQRRSFLAGAAAGLLPSELVLPIPARAEAAPPAAPAATRGGAQGIGPIRQLRAGALDVGFHEAGPVDGLPVLLLHGYPYDIHSFAEVAPRLAARGCRVIVPWLRGYGSTHFVRADAPRNAQQSAVALDQVALLDALGVERALVVGYDWGARTACVMGALWPERCLGIVSVGGYIVTNLAASSRPLPAETEHAWWYQYYFATENGRAGLAAHRRDIARILWRTNSPQWHFDDATFERSATAFDNPDHVDIVIHNYRWRLGLTAGHPSLDGLEKRLAARPVIPVPTLTIDADSSGIAHATDGTAYAAMFSDHRGHRVLQAGHNVPQEAPQAFEEAVWTLASTLR